MNVCMCVCVCVYDHCVHFPSKYTLILQSRITFGHLHFIYSEAGTS
uniref:Uncharacterized protein n=1 Tax=Anguilla anguilla TaxID=7936 RepID=A0A0E9SYX4_ANGAN